MGQLWFVVFAHVQRLMTTDKRFLDFDTLTVHVSEDHVGSGRSEYTCDWKACPRSKKPFAQRQKLMRHLQTHTGYRPLTCSECQQRFSDLPGLNQHQRTHTGEKPFTCSQDNCDKAFALSSALKAHTRIHSDERPYACTFDGCGKNFRERSNLSKHTKVHTKEKNYVCDHCQRGFTRSDLAKRHLKVHQPETS